MDSQNIVRLIPASKVNEKAEQDLARLMHQMSERYKAGHPLVQIAEMNGVVAAFKYVLDTYMHIPTYVYRLLQAVNVKEIEEGVDKIDFAETLGKGVIKAESLKKQIKEAQLKLVKYEATVTETLKKIREELVRGQVLTRALQVQETLNAHAKDARADLDRKKRESKRAMKEAKIAAAAASLPASALLQLHSAGALPAPQQQQPAPQAQVPKPQQQPKKKTKPLPEPRPINDQGDVEIDLDDYAENDNDCDDDSDEDIISLGRRFRCL